MSSGKVKWFNESIKAEGFKTLNEGQAVTYNAEQGPKGLHAVEVEVTS